jgi:hypothetical protein
MKSGKKLDLGFPVRVLSPKKNHRTPRYVLLVHDRIIYHVSCEKPLLFAFQQPRSKCVHNVQKVKKKSGKGFEPQTLCTMSGKGYASANSGVWGGEGGGLARAYPNKNFHDISGYIRPLHNIIYCKIFLFDGFSG